MVLLAVKPCVDDVKITSQHVLIATKRFAQPFDSAVFLNPNLLGGRSPVVAMLLLLLLLLASPLQFRFGMWIPRQ